MSAESPSCEVGADFLAPQPPEAPRFDPERGMWVLSRYEDVLGAFREPRLWPISSNGPDRSTIGAQAGQLRLRTETLEAFSTSRVAEWQAQIEPLAYSVLDLLPTGRPVDVVREFAQPWSLRAAAIVTEADDGKCDFLADLARQVSAASAEPRDPALQSAAELAGTELEKNLQGGIPMRAPAFVALSQTLPCFLANAWLALSRHPSELARLRERRDLMPRAIEELLRYAGLVGTLLRVATADVNLGSIRIAQGERVMLMVASANRDPEQFSSPDRLDLTRRVAGQLALGAGPHSCTGALLIRMAATIATDAFVHNFAAVDATAPVEWRGGSGFRSPASLYALFRRESKTS
jgi:cytochrome P450